MESLEELKQQVPAIEAKLKYTFRNPYLLVLAFIHRSFVNENREVKHHNERLEFLGDSVLGLLVTEHLYRRFPENPEGDLSHFRSTLVEASACMRYVTALDLAHFVLLGKGERMNDGRGRESILADLFEAIIGAIYLDGGLKAASDFLFGIFAEEMEAILKAPLQNWKALLQDYCQKQFQQTPSYEVLSESGPDHEKRFLIAVMMNEQKLGQGEGSSKKEAQQNAAEDAMEKLGSDLGC